MRKLRHFIALVLTVSLLCSVLIPIKASAYHDTQGHWASTAIERWTKHGVVQGDGTSFRPDARISGGEIAAILSRVLDFNTFSTENDTIWYDPYIRKCLSERITIPEDRTYISRQDAMIALSQALSVAESDRSALSLYSDADRVSDDAVSYVAGLISSGIVNGITPTLIAPEKSVTRAELLTMLDRAIIQVISSPGTYELAAQDGIILISSGDVIVSGKTPAAILITSGADGGVITFQDASVTGRFTVRANNTLIVNDNSELPEIGFFGWGSRLEVLPVEIPPVLPAVSGKSKYEPVYKALNVSEPRDIDGGVYSYVTIESGLGDGEVTLRNITINDDLIIQGGGSNSIHLVNCTVKGKVRMEKSGGEPPRLCLSNTPISMITTANPAIIEAADADSVIQKVQSRSDLTIQGAETVIESLTIADADQEVSLHFSAGHVKQLQTHSSVQIINENTVIDSLYAGGRLTLEKGDFPSVCVPAGTQAEVILDEGRIGRIEINGNAKLRGEYDTVNARGSLSLQEGSIKKLYTPVGSGNAVAVTVAPNTLISEAEINRLTAFDVSGSVAHVLAYSDVTLMHGRLPKMEIFSKTPDDIHLTIIDDAEIEQTVLNTSNKIILHGEENTVFVAADQTVLPRIEQKDALPAKHIHIYSNQITTQPATCTQAGTLSAKCIQCGYVLSSEIAATGHCWDNGCIIDPPAVKHEGVKQFTCLNCAQTRTESIPELSPDASEEKPAFSISNIHFSNENGALYLVWDAAYGGSGSAGAYFSVEMKQEDGSWKTITSLLYSRRCSLLWTTADRVHYTAARIKMYANRQLIAETEQEISFDINTTAPMNDIGVCFRQYQDTVRATVRNAVSGRTCRLDIMTNPIEQRTFVPDADGNAYVDLNCDLDALRETQYQLLSFVSSASRDSAALTIERTAWSNCTDAFSENHELSYAVDENHMLILQTDIDNIDECVLMLNSAEDAENLRIELKDGLTLTERLLSQPNAYYTSASLLRPADDKENVLAHSNQILNVSGSLPPIEITGAERLESGRLSIHISGNPDAKYCYFLCANDQYLPLEAEQDQLTCMTDLDLDGQRIDVIRTQVLKSGDVFTLYCSARGDGFKFPEKETEPDIKEPEKDPEKEPGKDNPGPTDEIFIEQIQKGGEVRLTAPVTITDNSNNINLEKNVTLDLNGQTLNLSAISLCVTEGVSLTIKDSEGSGEIQSSVSIIDNQGGTIRIEGGALSISDSDSSSCALYQQSGEMTITGGTFTGTANSAALAAMGGTIRIEDGIFEGPVAIRAFSKAKITMTGGELRGSVVQKGPSEIVIGENVLKTA